MHVLPGTRQRAALAECALATQSSATHNMWLVGLVSERPPQQASNQVRPSLPASSESWMSRFLCWMTCL